MKNVPENTTFYTNSYTYNLVILLQKPLNANTYIFFLLKVQEVSL